MCIRHAYLLMIAPLTVSAGPARIENLVAIHDPTFSWILVLSSIITGVLATLVTKHVAVRYFLLAIGMGVSSACFAPVIAVPNSFSNGQPADANQVNANFDDVVAQIANHADNEDLHSDDTAESFVTLESDGSVSFKAPGSSSGIFLRPNGNIEIIGNTVTVNAGANAEITAGANAVINASLDLSTNAGTSTNVTSGGDISMQGASAVINAGSDFTLNAGSTTNLNSGGAISLQGATIDLN